MKPPPSACRQCRHYYVTWDPWFPHGCRAMGFKSRRSPNAEVREAMQGQDCVLFARKPTSTGTERFDRPDPADGSALCRHFSVKKIKA